MPVAAVAVAVAGLLGEDGGDALGDLVDLGQLGVGEDAGGERGRKGLGVALVLVVGGDGGVGGVVFGGGLGGVLRSAGEESERGQDQDEKTHSLAVARNAGARFRIHWEDVIGAQFLRNLIERRNLLFQLAKRDFRQRYIGSAAGWLWGLVHPLVMLTSWTFVFQYCMKSEMPPGALTSNYTIFLLCGYLPWMLFQETVTRSANSLLEHSNLITKTLFPSEMLPISVFFSSLANHLLALALSLVAVAYFEGGISPYALLLPLYMALIGLLGVGIGWVFASLQVYVRDTAQAVLVLLTFWFWMTPIFITEDKIPEGMRFLIRGNPMSLFVRAYRERLLSTDAPQWDELAIVMVWSVSAFFLGGLFFRHLKRGFADVL